MDYPKNRSIKEIRPQFNGAKTQGYKGIRQCPINCCTMYIPNNNHKINPYVHYVSKKFGHSTESTIQN